MNNSTYNNNSRQTTNNYASNNSLGAYSSLIDDQVYNKNSKTGGRDPYSEATSPYSKKQNWDKAKIYQDQGGLNTQLKKFKRFNDLKILNEEIINLSNNMQPEESPLEVLSQGQKGEIKNTLMARIFKISILPAFSALLLSLGVIFFEHLLVTLFLFSLYVFVIGRAFFYPAKLYYENIQYKTTKHAKLFYEEMDFWFKMSVVKIIIYFFVVILSTFIMAFFEDALISLFLDYSMSLKGSSQKIFSEYVSTISFSYTLLFLSFVYIGTILLYFKFINREKAKNEELLKVKLRNIRNQTMSRVEQIQADKNEIY